MLSSFCPGQWLMDSVCSEITPFVATSLATPLNVVKTTVFQKLAAEFFEIWCLVR